MIDRLYDNGMLMSGEARHCNCWEYPTMPRLRRDLTAQGPAVSQTAFQMPSRKRGYVAILIDVLRSK
jgi:hypothetical protein